MRSGPWGNQLVTEAELRRRLETKSALEWGTSTREPSKKEVREWENEQALGGLRNPWVAVAKNSGLKWLGTRVRRAFNRLLVTFPRALECFGAVELVALSGKIAFGRRETFSSGRGSRARGAGPWSAPPRASRSSPRTPGRACGSRRAPPRGSRGKGAGGVF